MDVVSKQLDGIAGRIHRLGGRDSADWDSLAVLNADLRGVLGNLHGQAEEWGWELDAREALQARLVDAPEQPDRIRRLWLAEQRDFYLGLVDRMERYLRHDESAAVTFALTAQEILLLVRLLVETGVIRTDTLRPIFRYLSYYGSTERYGSLSFESLKKRYSLRHEGARKQIRKLLLNMIERIDRPSPEG